MASQIQPWTGSHQFLSLLAFQNTTLSILQETNENLSPPVITAVLRELKDLTDKPSEGIAVR